MNENPAEAKRREAAKAKLLKRLRSQKSIDIGHWSREELYERTEEEKRAARSLSVWGSRNPQ